MSYIIGIDLGTTNCALAYTAANAPDPLHLPPVELFAVPQLVNPGEVRDEDLLPSFLYLPGPNDFPPGSLALPWPGKATHIVGQLAQKRGAENVGRLVSSAKSWLSYSGIDRTAALLPVAAPDGVSKISPLAASKAYLEHLRFSWNERKPDAVFSKQSVLITVPASFDASARELTQQAAEQAGYTNVILLEEPQAAFYAWLERHPDWRERVKVGDLILVVDIGGGTTDFTLIAVKEEGGELQLERIAVGEHILLGGDNMDLALARTVEAHLAAKNTKLDTMQLNGLWQQCRIAKEKLLEPGNKQAESPVTILGRGTGLVGGTIKGKVTREDLERVFLDGFFPKCGRDEMPQVRKRAGLQEIGLPYAAEAAVTRHLAKFLAQQPQRPTHVLFNGGVLRASIIRNRILETLSSWQEKAVVPLEGEDLMHAVARGAAYYGLARQGKGVRIRGGISRAYYVGIESSMPAIPGMPAPMKALTVAPFGMEEGTKAEIPQREFALVVGEPAEFRFLCSATRHKDIPGEMIEQIGDDIEEITPMEVELSADKDAGQFVRVTLGSEVTETGVLQLWCVAKDGRRWKLEFNVREKVAAA